MTEIAQYPPLQGGRFYYPDLFNITIPENEVHLCKADCIRTSSGRYVNVFDPKPEMFCLEDICHSLSYMPRFGGHLPDLYSVLQHQTMCSYFVEDEKDAFDALHHDDSEAFLLDVPTPIKRKLVGYKETESGVMVVLSEVIGFNWPLSEGVKRVDAAMLQFEWDHLMHGKPLPTWMDPDFTIWSPEESRARYLERHYELVAKGYGKQ